MMFVVKFVEGYDADFIVLDQNLDLVATYLDGVKRYQATN